MGRIRKRSAAHMQKMLRHPEGDSLANALEASLVMKVLTTLETERECALQVVQDSKRPWGSQTVPQLRNQLCRTGAQEWNGKLTICPTAISSAGTAALFSSCIVAWIVRSGVDAHAWCSKHGHGR